MAWHEDLLVGFDLATAGTAPRQARSGCRAPAHAVGGAA
jgi:hypothetical protein